MKAVLFILLTCFSATTFVQGQNDTDEISIDAQSKFGRLSKDCKGRGICSFTSDNISISQVNSQIIFTESGIILTIYRDRITAEDEVKIVGSLLSKDSNLGNLTLTMHDDFELDANSQLITITKGSYPIEVTNNTFIITFK